MVSIAASVICNQLLFRGGGVRGSASFVTFLALAPFAFGIAGGVLIRRAAPMTEVFWLAAYGAAWPAVSLFVAWAGDSTACTAPAGSGCDTGLGLGAVLVFAGCYVPSLAGVALGKVLGAGRGRTGRSA